MLLRIISVGSSCHSRECVRCCVFWGCSVFVALKLFDSTRRRRRHATNSTEECGGKPLEQTRGQGGRLGCTRHFILATSVSHCNKNTSIIAAMIALWLRHNLKITERRLVVLYDIFAFSVFFCEIIFLYSSGFRVLLSGIFGSREH